MAISKQTAKKIHFETFPLSDIVNPVTKKSDPGIRILPIEIPGLGIFPSVTSTIYEVQPTLIPPSLFFERYDVEVTSRYIIFKTKSYHEPVIQYIKPAMNKNAIITPGEKLPIIPFSVGNVVFPGTLDTGTNENEITKQTAKSLQMDVNHEVYHVPVAVPATGIVLEMDLHVTDIPYNVISAEEYLKRGFHITYTERGIRFG